MKIVILGSDSQIGILFNNNFKNFNFFKLNKKNLDIKDLDNAYKILKNIQPNVIINTAAFTDVDLSEVKSDEAFQVNSLGPKNLSIIASEINSFLIHFSTDYVFDGLKNSLYNEIDKTNPISVYGKSKLSGEENIITHCANYIIVRISWLYGSYKKNFVTEIINLLIKGNKLKVIDDQFSKPTCSKDVYELLIKILDYIDKGYNQNNIFNYSNEGNSVSRYEFANHIANYYCKPKNIDFNISPINSEIYYKKQIRPKFSALNCNKIYNALKINPIDWKYSLENTINDIIINKKES